MAKNITIKSALPFFGESRSGIGLVGLMIYTVLFAGIALVILETQSYIKEAASKPARLAEDVDAYIDLPDRLKEIFALSDSAGSLQKAGTQAGGSALPLNNCVNLSRTVNGVTTEFSVAVHPGVTTYSCPVYDLSNSDISGIGLPSTAQPFCVVKLAGWVDRYEFHPVSLDGSVYVRDCDADYGEFVPRNATQRTALNGKVSEVASLIADKTTSNYLGETSIRIYSKEIPSLSSGVPVTYLSRTHCDGLPGPADGATFCGDLPDTWGSEPLTGSAYKIQDGTAETFFRGTGAADSAGRFKDFDFVHSTDSSESLVGVENAVTRLSIGQDIARACRIASPDGEWFTDFGPKKIRHMTVYITLNKSSEDRLRLVSGTHSDVKVKNFEDLGVLHLYAPNGKTTDEWLDVATDVEYYRTDYSAVSDSTPPRTFSFSLGPGLPYTVAGIPSTHYYLMQQLNTDQNWGGSDSAAQSFCYPPFVSDDNFLSRGETSWSESCAPSGSSYPRLTGHLPTLTTEGEHEFLKENVLDMVYPWNAPASGNPFWTSAERTLGREYLPTETDHDDESRNVQTLESDPTFALGGWYGPKLHGNNGGDKWRWIRGFAMGKDSSNKNAFADWHNNKVRRLSGDSAGRFYNSIKSSPNRTHKHRIYFDPDGFGGDKYWDVQNSSTTYSVVAVEFGDNVNSIGNCQDSGNSCNHELSLNQLLKLTREVRLIPKEFFDQCSAD